jgi:NhaA family Na+:H+ antiporter
MSIRKIDRWLVVPLYRFMKNSSASSIVLLAAAVIALGLSNSLLAGPFGELWQVPFTISLGNFAISKPLLYWINDGLMSMFFFVVGLELKREFVAGELSDWRNLLLPVIAGLGGMVMPAAIYSLFNFQTGTEALNGWGIPMATDIAFTLGVLYLLGKRVPLSLKVFLTTLAIIDDLGAVSVIAFFYTSNISLVNLAWGGLFLSLMMLGNRLGVRSAVYYGVLGIGGLWLAFLFSGVHATIAAVLAAFTIPASVRISKDDYISRMRALLKRFTKAPCTTTAMATPAEQAILDKIERSTHAVVPPLQKLEHALHPIVAFGVIPIFALANAGVSFSGNLIEAITSSVSMGIMLGLVGGKVLGIVGFVYLFDRLGLLRLPPVLSYRHIIGAAFLAAIGFTMSLFITSLAFEEQAHIQQAKLGILAASLFAGLAGYLILRSCSTEATEKQQRAEHRQSLSAELLGPSSQKAAQRIKQAQQQPEDVSSPHS